MNISRKDFLKFIAGSAAVGSLPFQSLGASKTAIELNDLQGEGAPDDEKFWRNISRKYYPLSKDFINLENGYFGLQPKPVLEAYQGYVQQVNSEGALFARREYPKKAREAHAILADFLGVEEGEILVTRNATEALNIAIQGYPWKEGDEVLVNQLDYYSMIETFQMLEERGRLKVKTFEMPLLPDSSEAIMKEYEQRITDKTRVILLTQVSNITGLITPVKAITSIAKSRGIDTITDAAHALGHIPFNLKDMGSPFVGMNLHKWMGNPIGAGVLYVDKNRVAELETFYGDKGTAKNDIRRLSHFGTTPFAVQLSIPHAIEFHQNLGIDRISQRVDYLKNLWIDKVSSNPNVEVLTPQSSDLSCGIASFRIVEKTGKEVENELLDKHPIFTVARVLGEKGCLRVTPGIYTQASDMINLAEAISEIAS